MRTIWGVTDHQKKLADGVYEVQTPSHGGIVVEERVADKYLSQSAKFVATLDCGLYHFEEDAEWAIFAKENPTLFSEKTLQHVDATLEHYCRNYLYYIKREKYLEELFKKFDKNKSVYFYSFVADCEHDGDIRREENWMLNIIGKYKGYISDSYWDGHDCGEAYVEGCVPFKYAHLVAFRFEYDPYQK